MAVPVTLGVDVADSLEQPYVSQNEGSCTYPQRFLCLDFAP